jgi:rhodanese-related sulfurtransferase
MQYDFAAAKAYFTQKAAATTGPHELQGMLDRKEDIVVVDVRYPADFRKAHIPGAVSLPKGKWQGPRGLSKDTGLPRGRDGRRLRHLGSQRSAGGGGHGIRGGLTFHLTPSGSAGQNRARGDIERRSRSPNIPGGIP